MDHQAVGFKHIGELIPYKTKAIIKQGRLFLYDQKLENHQRIETLKQNDISINFMFGMPLRW